MKTTHISTDVLVIGGGAAGCSAALKAHEVGASVLMVVKGKMGRSGATPLASALGFPVPIPGPYPFLRILKQAYSKLANHLPLPLPRRYRNFMSAVGSLHYWLVEQDYFLDYALWLDKVFYPTLESTGLYGRRDESGQLITPGDHQLDFHIHSNGMTGYQFGESRRKAVLCRNIPLMEEAMVFALLTGSGGDVTGAMVLDYATGRLYAIAAKNTIIATGHTNWLASRATGTREMAANGLAMAARVGVESVNLEMQWFHASDAAQPRAWMRLHHYPNPLSATVHKAVMLNSAGQEYLKIEDFASDIPYVIQMKKLYGQVKAGLCSWNSGSFASYRLVEPQALDQYQYHGEFYRKLGLQMSSDPLECAVTWHMTGGGLRADVKTMQTSVPGLYIAGGVGGHMLGALCLATYDGEVAGEHAARAAWGIAMPTVARDAVRKCEQRVADLIASVGSGTAVNFSPIQIKRKIRSIMSEGMMYVKTEQGLQRVLAQLAEVEALLPRMRLRTAAIAYNSDLVDALDIPHMLDACRLATHSSLARKESRGPHFREDFPFTDNAQWLKRSVSVLRGHDVAVKFEPVPQKYLKPGRRRLDYLNHPYI